MELKKEVLKEILSYKKVDVIAETSQGLSMDTYIYIWNQIIKDSKEDIDILSVWDEVPKKHKDDILKSQIQLKRVKKTNYGSEDSISLGKITSRPLFDGDDYLDDYGYLLQINKDGKTFEQSFTLNEIEEAQKKFKIVEEELNKKNFSKPKRKM